MLGTGLERLIVLCLQVKTTSPKKYSVRPNVGVLAPKATCEFIGIASSYVCLFGIFPFETLDLLFYTLVKLY